MSIELTIALNARDQFIAVRGVLTDTVITIADLVGVIAGQVRTPPHAAAALTQQPACSQARHLHLRPNTARGRTPAPSRTIATTIKIVDDGPRQRCPCPN